MAPANGGYLLSHEVNDSFVAVNRLLKANEDVFWLKSSASANGKTYPVGTIYIAAKPTTLPCASIRPSTASVAKRMPAT